MVDADVDPSFSPWAPRHLIGKDNSSVAIRLLSGGGMLLSLEEIKKGVITVDKAIFKMMEDAEDD